jgi:hypothetical protein
MAKASVMERRFCRERVLVDITDPYLRNLYPELDNINKKWNCFLYCSFPHGPETAQIEPRTP